MHAIQQPDSGKECSLPIELTNVFLDDRGTPATTNVDVKAFIVGGICFQGQAQRIADAWVKRRKLAGITASKGRRVRGDALLEVAHFLVEHRLLPVATFSRVDEPSLAQARASLKLLNTASTTADVAPAHWLWMAQVLAAAVVALGAVRHAVGRLTRLHLAMDKFMFDPEHREQFRRMLEQGLTAGHLLQNTPRPDTAPVEDRPTILQMMDNMRVGPGDCEVDLNAKGPLADLADVVVALYGRAFLQHDDGRAAWAVLLGAFRHDGEPILSLGFDVTEHVTLSIDGLVQDARGV
ncbi:hypothetical protein ACFL6C_05030 [Myxococcota bacterium]